jgi:hypothetical protein
MSWVRRYESRALPGAHSNDNIPAITGWPDEQLAALAARGMRPACADSGPSGLTFFGRRRVVEQRSPWRGRPGVAGAKRRVHERRPHAVLRRRPAFSQADRAVRAGFKQPQAMGRAPAHRAAATVEDAQLRVDDANTLDPALYRACVHARRGADAQPRDVYCQPAWRVKRCGAHVDAHRHEDLMARQLRETYGPPGGGLHRDRQLAGGARRAALARRGAGDGYRLAPRAAQARVRDGLGGRGLPGWARPTRPRECSSPVCSGHVEHNWLSTATLVYQGPGRGMRRRRVWKLSRCTRCRMVWQRDVNEPHADRPLYTDQPPSPSRAAAGSETRSAPASG